MPSLEGLVDTVFMGGKAGVMRSAFPALFNRENLSRLLVYADGGRVVSHVGRTERWASLGGCTVRIACIGAVATYEEYRGRNLATQLLKAACEEAEAAGVDFMLISGDRTLYRRPGAASVGLDYRAALGSQAAERLACEEVTIRPFEPGDLPAWKEAYAAKTAHFVRPPEDWRWFIEARFCQGSRADFHTVLWREAVCGYVVSRVSDRDLACVVLEHAGASRAVAAAFPRLLTHHKQRELGVHVQGFDAGLFRLLEGAGAAFEPVHATGTVLVLNFPRLAKRLRPWFESMAGMEPGCGASIREEGAAFVFEVGNERIEADGRMAATELLFGNHHRTKPAGLWGRMLPVPSLWYGLNYV